MILKVVLTIFAILVMAFVVMAVLALAKKGGSVYKNEAAQKNLLEGKRVVFVPNDNEPENADGVRGHLEAVGESEHKEGIEVRYRSV